MKEKAKYGLISLSVLALCAAIGAVTSFTFPYTVDEESKSQFFGTYDGSFTAFADEETPKEAEETVTTVTKGAVSVDGRYLLIITGIDAPENYAQYGYYVSVDGAAAYSISHTEGEGDDMVGLYHTSVTLKTTSGTMREYNSKAILGTAYAGIIVHEIAYEPTAEYEITPWFLPLLGDAKSAPSVARASYTLSEQTAPTLSEGGSATYTAEGKKDLTVTYPAITDEDYDVTTALVDNTFKATYTFKGTSTTFVKEPKVSMDIEGGKPVIKVSDLTDAAPEIATVSKQINNYADTNLSQIDLSDLKMQSVWLHYKENQGNLPANAMASENTSVTIGAAKYTLKSYEVDGSYNALRLDVETSYTAESAYVSENEGTVYYNIEVSDVTDDSWLEDAYFDVQYKGGSHPRTVLTDPAISSSDGVYTLSYDITDMSAGQYYTHFAEIGGDTVNFSPAAQEARRSSANYWNYSVVFGSIEQFGGSAGLIINVASSAYRLNGARLDKVGDSVYYVLTGTYDFAYNEYNAAALKTAIEGSYFDLQRNGGTWAREDSLTSSVTVSEEGKKVELSVDITNVSRVEYITHFGGSGTNYAISESLGTSQQVAGFKKYVLSYDGESFYGAVGLTVSNSYALDVAAPTAAAITSDGEKVYYTLTVGTYENGSNTSAVASTLTSTIEGTYLDFESTSSWARTEITGKSAYAANGNIYARYDITALGGGQTYFTHYGSSSTNLELSYVDTETSVALGRKNYRFTYYWNTLSLEITNQDFSRSKVALEQRDGNAYLVYEISGLTPSAGTEKLLKSQFSGKYSIDFQTMGEPWDNATNITFDFVRIDGNTVKLYYKLTASGLYVFANGWVMHADGGDFTEYSIIDRTRIVANGKIYQLDYDGSNYWGAVGLKVENLTDPVLSLSGEGEYTLEAENINSSNWVKAGSNPTVIVERNDASNGQFLAAITGNGTSADKGGSFNLNLAFDATIVLSVKYAQPETYKNNEMDMRNHYVYLIDGTREIGLTENYTLAAREYTDGKTTWDTITYDPITLSAGTHTVQVYLRENPNGKGTPNIDCFKFSITLPENEFHTFLQYQYLQDDYDNVSKYVSGSAENSRPNPFTLDFSGEVADNDSYVVQYADNAAFEGAVSVTVTEKSYDLYNLKLGQDVYWRAGVSALDAESGSVHHFIVNTETPRNLYVDGTTNVRDIGGYASSLVEGGKIKQGLYYRGYNLDELTADGIDTIVNVLGVKQEIDIRNSEQQYNSPFATADYGVNYTAVEIRDGTEARRFEEFAEEYTTIFSLIANAQENPVYLHCWSGADRTGICTFMLLTVCGVSYEDAARDYLFTNFSTQGSRSLGSEFNVWYNKLNQYAGATKAEQAKNWLISKGITAKQVETIRETFVEGYAAVNA